MLSLLYILFECLFSATSCVSLSLNFFVLPLPAYTARSSYNVNSLPPDPGTALPTHEILAVQLEVGQGNICVAYSTQHCAWHVHQQYKVSSGFPSEDKHFRHLI